MAPSYKFSVIQARPDPQRGERVNVGIIVQGPDRLDTRFPELRKLKPLTGHAWEEIAKVYSENILSKKDLSLDLAIAQNDLLSEVFTIGRPGSFLALNNSEYEDRVKSILEYFVLRPVLSKKEKTEKINSEIARALKSAGVYGQPGQSIDEGRVIPKFVVSDEKDIVADFAYRTSRLKIVSTLDLRTAKSLHGKACEKGATLYFAKEKFGPEMQPFGVYAVEPKDKSAKRSEIEILRSFADGNVFNWSDAQDRRRFNTALY